LLDMRMRRPIPESERAALAERVIAAAAPFGEDPYAVRARAGAELIRGAPETARTLLEPLLVDESDWEAQYLVGLSYFNQAQHAAPAERAGLATRSRRYFARAYHLNPHHVPTLYYYAKSYMYDPRPMPASALDVLIQAHLLAPQVGEIAMNLGIQLMHAGRYDEAAAVIRPIAISPHQNGGSRAARQLLEAALNHQPPPALRDDDDDQSAGASAPP
jgi:tetratricopeptide (TPR) repeat protein